MNHALALALAAAFPPQGEAPPVPDGSALETNLLLLAFLALAPFLLSMITSFAKLVIVCGLLRQALGMPQIPPNSVITGLAFVLTIHIMAPVASECWRAASRPEVGDSLDSVIASCLPPVREFARRHGSSPGRELFRELRAELEPPSGGAPMAAVETATPWIPELIEMVTVEVPAFVLQELKEAFQIGFLLFIPFLIVDLVVSNVLLAMGMHMLSPLTISLPLKILLFVLVDGWEWILRGVVLGYAAP